MNLNSLLNIDLPLIQAPMAGVQLHGLAAAVSNAGGLGSLPCALLDAAGWPRGADGIRIAACIFRNRAQCRSNLDVACVDSSLDLDRSWRRRIRK